MKLRNYLFLVLVAMIAVMVAGSFQGGEVNWSSLFGAAFVLFVVGNLLSRPCASLFATLTTTEILQDTMDAFTTMLPMLSSFSTNLSNDKSKKGETVLVHIDGLPSVQDYDNANGFKPNAADVANLLTDVPVVLNRLKHVPVKIGYLTQLASRKNLYERAVKNYAYVLAKDVIDYILSLVIANNVTHSRVAANLNVSLDTLENLRSDLNGQFAAPSGRFGLVSSAFSAALQGDSRVASGDYYGQLNGGNAYRHFTNIAGFENVWEYPAFPTNAINLSGFFGDPRAVAFASTIPSVQADLAAELNIPQIANFEVLEHPDTGLRFLGIAWQEQGTFDVYVTVAILYGASVGAQAGGANAITDKACTKTVTA